MKRLLAPYLICPACLPREHSLDLRVDKEGEGGDISSGTLVCRSCSKRYPIRDGIALLLTDPGAAPSGGQWRYEEGGTLSTYLWSHYADLMGDREAGSAYAEWAGLLAQREGMSLDAGCATGRLTFEMAARSGFAVGCDLSLSFIRMARRIAHERAISFTLPGEGRELDEFSLSLPAEWRSDNVEFVLADVLRLPFARELFSQVSSVNLIDRVRYPLAHLYELNRVARKSPAAFLFSDPFSWSDANTPEEAWLGGTDKCAYPGRGIDNVRQLLQGKENVIAPPWHIDAAGEVWWKIRSHRNHFELIRSNFLAASRV